MLKTRAYLCRGGTFSPRGGEGVGGSKARPAILLLGEILSGHCTSHKRDFFTSLICIIMCCHAVMVHL